MKLIHLRDACKDRRERNQEIVQLIEEMSILKLKKEWYLTMLNTDDDNEIIDCLRVRMTLNIESIIKNEFLCAVS